MEGLRCKLAVVGLPGEADWRGEIEKIEKSSPKDSWGQYSSTEFRRQDLGGRRKFPGRHQSGAPFLEQNSK